MHRPDRLALLGSEIGFDGASIASIAVPIGVEGVASSYGVTMTRDQVEAQTVQDTSVAPMDRRGGGWSRTG